MPSQRAVCAAVVLADQLFVLGGRTPGAQATAETARFDLAEACWYTCPDMPVARTGLAAVAEWQ